MVLIDLKSLINENKCLIIPEANSFKIVQKMKALVILQKNLHLKWSQRMFTRLKLNLELGIKFYLTGKKIGKMA